MRKTKIFSIISLFHSPNQTNSNIALTIALIIASDLDLEREPKVRSWSWWLFHHLIAPLM